MHWWQNSLSYKSQYYKINYFQNAAVIARWWCNVNEKTLTLTNHPHKKIIKKGNTPKSTWKTVTTLQQAYLIQNFCLPWVHWATIMRRIVKVSSWTPSLSKVKIRICWSGGCGWLRLPWRWRYPWWRCVGWWRWGRDWRNTIAAWRVWMQRSSWLVMHSPSEIW